jgi:hypothetical protein
MGLLGGGKGVPNRAEALESAFIAASAKKSHAWLLEYLTECIELADVPAAQRAQRLEALDQRGREAPTLARMLVPAARKTFFARDRTEAKKACAIAALAAERFRRDEGRWPQRLDELGPKHLKQVPDDPCSGKPLQLRPTRDGIVIFSVGPEGKFDGSYRDDPKTNPLAGSYEFRLWNVTQRRQIGAARQQ